MMERHRLDVQDIDTEWFTNLVVYLDRTRDVWHFPEESIRRLADEDEDAVRDTEHLWLLDGRVEVKADEIDVDGQPVKVWSVPIGQIVTRPAT